MFYCLHIRPYFPVMNDGIKRLSKKPSGSKNVNAESALRGSLS